MGPLQPLWARGPLLTGVKLKKNKIQVDSGKAVSYVCDLLKTVSHLHKDYLHPFVLNLSVNLMLDLPTQYRMV